MKIRIPTTVLFLSVLAVNSLTAANVKMNGKLKVGQLSQSETLFTGKPFNRFTGTYVFNFRNYDPATARWTSADPSGFPDGANNHKYVRNAVSQFDATGLEEQWALIGETPVPDIKTSWAYGVFIPDMNSGNFYRFRIKAEWEWQAVDGSEHRSSPGNGVTLEYSTTITQTRTWTVEASLPFLQINPIGDALTLGGSVGGEGSTGITVTVSEQHEGVPGKTIRGTMLVARVKFVQEVAYFDSAHNPLSGFLGTWHGHKTVEEQPNFFWTSLDSWVNLGNPAPVEGLYKITGTRWESLE